MIKEIIQFVDVLPEETFTRNLALDEGLYLFLDIQKRDDKYCLVNVDENGNILTEDKLVVNKNTEKTPLYYRFLSLKYYTIPVSDKKHFNPSAKIFNLTCSPYAIGFKQKGIIKSENEIDEALKQYFETSIKYTDQRNLKYSEMQEGFSKFCRSQLKELYLKELSLISKKDGYRYFLFLKNISSEFFDFPYSNYLRDKAFNKNEYNYPKTKKDQIPDLNTYGVSDSLSVFQDKKLFLQHKTGINYISKRILLSDAIKTWKFIQLQKNNLLPNPTPIFVDKDELPLINAMVSLYNDNQNLSFSEIIKSLLEKKQSDLQNFYLIFFQNGLKGSKINDLDFVPVFKYTFNSTIVNIFKLRDHNKNILPNYPTKNIFEFEDLLHRNIFYTTQTKTGFRYGFLKGHYFDKKPEPSKGYDLNPMVRYLLLKFGKAIYDFIYKSREKSFSSIIFDEIMCQSILYDIRYDDRFLNDKYIKEKLNIWFSLYNYFQISNQSKRENMVNKTAELIEKLKDVARNERLHISNDDEFAFGSGQLIWKILSQSKSASRSHALLEPFLQKVEPMLFKQAIAKAFDTYKHEFVFNQKKNEFDKVMSEIMGYEPNEKNMKNQLPLILAGYFAESIF